MVTPSQVAVLAILAPIAVAIFSHLVAKLVKNGAKLAKAICILVSYIVLLLVFLLFLATAAGPVRTQLFTLTLSSHLVEMGLYVDYLALTPALLSSVFTALALTYNVYYLSPDNKAYKIGKEFNRSYSFILLFNGAMLGTLFSSNLLSLAIFWELVSVCSYVLISFWNEDQFSLWAATKCFIMTHVGSMSLLMATIIIYFNTGTLEITEIGQKIPLGSAVITVILPLLLIAALPKTVLFPFHTWLPDGTVAPTSATVLFHVCGFQSGIYIIARFFLHVFYSQISSAPPMPLPLLFGNISSWSFVISLIGAITLVVGALNGIVENDFKRIVAYSTISQLGYIVLAVGLTSPLSLTAALFHMISHALYCGLLFLCAGAVIYATGKYNINDIGGLYNYMPITTVCCLIGILSLSTVPLLSDFASKYLIFHSSISIGATFYTIVAFVGCVLNVAIAIRLLHSVFMQKVAKSVVGLSIKDPPVFMLAPMMLASVALVIFGILPTIPLSYLVIPAVEQIGFTVDVVNQTGLIKTPFGFWNPTAVSISMLTLTAVCICMLLYSKKIGKVYRGSFNEEKSKPFLCGEDLGILDGPRGYHFYHVLTNVLKVNRITSASDVDRIYNWASTKFFNFNTKLLRFDMRQRYFSAVVSFAIGATAVALMAVLVG